MPASIFSETELARLASFPEEIPGDDLIRAFTLTGELDGLLKAKASNSWSTLKWLGQGASGESPGSIKSEVAKLAFLRQLGAHEWDLSDLNPNRRKFLAQVGRRSTSQTLQRMPAVVIPSSWSCFTTRPRLFSRLGRLVLDPDIPDEQLRRRSFEEVASRELFAGRGRGNRAASPSARRLLSRLRREPLWHPQEIRSTGPEGAGRTRA